MSDKKRYVKLDGDELAHVLECRRLALLTTRFLSIVEGVAWAEVKGLKVWRDNVKPTDDAFWVSWGEDRRVTRGSSTWTPSPAGIHPEDAS